jgi:hypothetical protein
MRILSTLFFLFGFLLSIQAQSESEDFNPLNFWEGKWILKTTEVDPLPANEEWESEIGVNEFTSILKGNGLHRTVNQGGQQYESFFFWDEKLGRVYTFSIDPNGLVWETSAKITKEKKKIYFIGGAKNNSSMSIETILETINENEVHFDQTILESGKKISNFKGVWYRMPE